ncbi:HPr family phosphocarrier protein [Caproiciproducens sp. CPB-2]|uniref:HPr family phosphocarrier protein n=1 Tax=unclassified Caproiciproducens TaxID=2643836 RepID=UPI0023D9E235|nr:HPr family phosphocarrier protein [Caproiciproducens sp. CPB-2]MDF1493456.1 HPr family phosphocarrier protein [Caproiciproducens sp. CPB-2]
MYQKEIVINNKTGLHARPASELVEFCKNIKSDIILKKGTEEINAKSILSILSGGVYQGTKLVVQVNGTDEQTAGPQVIHFLQNLSD